MIIYITYLLRTYFILLIYIMPYTSRKVRGKACYRVYNRKTRKVFSKCATAENAKKQMKLLRAIKYNKNFIFQKRRTIRRK
jgi:hypothetical protein